MFVSCRLYLEIYIYNEHFILYDKYKTKRMGPIYHQFVISNTFSRNVHNCYNILYIIGYYILEYVLYLKSNLILIISKNVI